MSKKTYIPTASIELKSDLSFEDLALSISEKIFLGAKFGNQNEYLCNEDPAVFFRPFLGLQFVLWHDVEELNVFKLDIQRAGNEWEQLTEIGNVNGEYFDISSFVEIVFKVAGFDVIENDEIDSAADD
ncbi:MAG: hypothetical protein ACSHXL_02175 [Bacteroidota bacterium]